MATGRPFFPGSTVEDQLHLIFKVSIYVDGRFSFFPSLGLVSRWFVRKIGRSIVPARYVDRQFVRSVARSTGRSLVRPVVRAACWSFVVCSFHPSAIWSASFISSNAVFAVWLSKASFWCFKGQFHGNIKGFGKIWATIHQFIHELIFGKLPWKVGHRTEKESVYFDEVRETNLKPVNITFFEMQRSTANFSFAVNVVIIEFFFFSF